MNVNYGLFPALPRRLRGREKKRALADLATWQADHGLLRSDPHPRIESGAGSSPLPGP